VLCAFLDEWPDGPVLGAERGQPAFDLVVAGAPDALRLMHADAVGYLPDDILCKVDRAAMAVSLESRVPLLDHRLAAVAARIPIAMKIRGGTGKHILRQLLYRHAPPRLFDRPKAGFAIPLGEWLRGPLRDWAETLLDPQHLEEGGWFDPTKVGQHWHQHLAGTNDCATALWPILMFQAWLLAAESPRATAGQWRLGNTLT
jgi:asparagine synthase (glutamine-hydrolysing)